MDTTRYPVGIQSFENLRNKGCVYVDKTEYVYQIAHGGSTTYFLSRPRRFGKSLLLSTLYAYFCGRKDLFESLAIYDMEKEWRSYPVIRFDFSAADASESVRLNNHIIETIKKYARDYDVALPSTDIGAGALFGNLIEEVSRKTGDHVVILIDEYDHGIHEALGDEQLLAANQDILRPFFAQIKAKEEYLRFCFITGVSRFRNYTLFSGFNNPDDISMNTAFAGICGITKTEMLDTFRDGIQALADSEGQTFDETVEALRLKYDGYRFTKSDTLVFNPFSIVNCLRQMDISNYWIKSGTPKVFVNYLSKSKFDLLELENLWVDKERMEGTYSEKDPIPLLFQTGYLTINDYDLGLYRLIVPNGEVRSALVNDLIPKYMGIARNDMPIMLYNLRKKLYSGDVDGVMTALQSLVVKIPYHELDLENIEKTYHLVVYELFLILGVDARSEVAIAGGRIDMVVKTKGYVYVFEFKLGGTVEEALDQIDDRGYALPWSADGRKVYKIGAVFSPKTRTLSEWRYQ